MKSNILNSVLRLLFILALIIPELSYAQKKKRGEETQQGIRLREAEFYFTEGEKFFILEDYAKELVYYQRAADINPDNGTIQYKIAEVLSKSEKQDDLIKASVSIEQALRLDSKNKYFYLLAAEIYYGLGWKPNPRILTAVESFIAERCELVPVSPEIARRSGGMRGAFQSRGRTRSLSDMLIAATAQVHQLTLVTRNLRDFEDCAIPLLNPID